MILKPSHILLVALALILCLGLASLYSSCHQKSVFVKKELFQKQLIWLAVGLVCLVFFWFFDYRKLVSFAWPMYGAAFAALAFVLTMGRAIMGAQRWISLGEFSFQPSELGKHALILLLARYFSKKTQRDLRASSRTENFFKAVFMPLVLTLVLTGQVLVQPDLGTAIVYVFIFFSIAFLAEVPLRYLGGLAAAGLSVMPVFWHFLRGYQKARLLVFLNPNIDPLGAGYTVIQSKIAIGSGRLFGKGWLGGTQSQLNFLPERHTDFIFSVIGEEWGFFGGVVLLFLFGLLLFAILKIAESSKDSFGRLFAGGVASVLFFHVFINIAMNAGACPVVGIPLPFVSYGGSSLVLNLAALGIVLSVYRRR